MLLRSILESTTLLCMDYNSLLNLNVETSIIRTNICDHFIFILPEASSKTNVYSHVKLRKRFHQ